MGEAAGSYLGPLNSSKDRKKKKKSLEAKCNRERERERDNTSDRAYRESIAFKKKKNKATHRQTDKKKRGKGGSWISISSFLIGERREERSARPALLTGRWLAP